MLLVLAAACVLLGLQQGAIVNADGYEVYEVTRSLVEDGDFSIEGDRRPGHDYGRPGRGGERFSRYGVGLSLLGVPAYVAAKPFAGLASSDLVTEAAVGSLMPLIGALLVGALFLLSRRLGARPAPAAVISLGAIFGTFLLPYTKDFFGEPLVALFTVVCIERALARKPTQAGLALAGAILTRPQAAAFAPLLLVVVGREGGLRDAARACWPIAAAILLSLGWNELRFGSLTESGYRSYERFTNPLPGAAGLLLSPDKSVALFAPALLLVPPALMALWRRDRPAAALIGGNFAVSFLLAASWWAWHGDWAWGPRLVIPGLVPLMAVLPAWVQDVALRRKAAVALFTAGLAVSASTVVIPMRAQQLDGVLRPTIARQAELVRPTFRYTAANATTDRGGDHRRFVNLWQINMIRELGTKGIAVAVAGSAVLLLLLWPILVRLVPLLSGPVPRVGPTPIPIPPPARTGGL